MASFCRRHLVSIYLLRQWLAGEAGPEAFRLARAHRGGVAVPPALVVLASAYRRAVALAGLDVWIDGLWEGPWDWARCSVLLERIRDRLRNHPAVIDLSEEIVRAARGHGAIEGLGPGAHLAILPSPTDSERCRQSFEGLHDSIWDVRPDGWAESLRRVWASLWNDRAFLYRRQKLLPRRHPEMAVLFRAWIPAERWGRMARVGETLEFEIHRRPGPVGGAEEFERCFLDGTRGKVTVFEGEGQLMAEEELVSLQHFATVLDRVFSAPQDCVWIWERGEARLLSCRDSPPDTEGFEWEWSRAHFKELLPELPSYYTTDYLLRHLPDGLGAFFHRAGQRPCPATMPAFRAFGGRPYLNLQWQRFQAERLGASDGDWERFFGGHPPTREGKPLGGGRHGPGLLDHFRILACLRATPRLARQHVRGVEMAIEAGRNLNMASMATLDLMLWREQNLRVLEAEGMQVTSHLLAGLSLGLNVLRKLLLPLVAHVDESLSLLVTGEGTGLASRQCLEFEDLVAEAHVWGLKKAGAKLPELTRLRACPEARAFLRRFDAFLARYGHRGLHESDEAEERFVDRPERLLELVAARLETGPPTDLRSRIEGRRHRRQRELDEVLRRARRRWVFPLGPLLASFIDWLLRRIRQFLHLREGNRSWKLRLMLLRKTLHGELARRWTREGVLERAEDFYYLGENEVAAASVDPRRRQGLRERVEKRRAMRPELLRLVVPDTFAGAVPEGKEPARPRHGEEAMLRGLAASPGLVEGRGRWCRSSEDLARLQAGEILLTASLDPTCASCLSGVAAVVVTMGGVLSHGFVLLRELGVPAVTNIPALEERVPDGALLRVDATAGTVELLKD